MIPDFAVWLSTLLLGALLSLYFVLLVEKQRKAHLDIHIERDPPQLADGRKFLRVMIRNRAINRFLGYFTARHPALACGATLEFLHQDKTPVFANGHKMIGRWANTPEPVNPQILLDSQGKIRLAMVRDATKCTDSVDIPPGETETLDVVVKVPNEQECHGWHNRLIENPSLSDEDRFDLPPGRYLVLVKVKTSGEEFGKTFRLVNDLPSIREFRLEEVSR